MYQITRKNRIKEDLQLCHADGSVALTLSVDLNVDEIGARVNKSYDALGQAQLALQKNPHSDEAMTAYGAAVMAVLTVIFGESGAEQLLGFYEGKYNEMLLDLLPFISDEVMPKIREASAQRKEQLLHAAKRLDLAKKGRRR